MGTTRTILFLCPHNAAKSVMAAAYARQLAAQRGLDLRVETAGTDPASRTSPAVGDALRAEGLDVSTHRPRLVRDDELAAAWRIVSLGCDLGDRSTAGGRVERWDDVPSPSQVLTAARQAIRRHLGRLLDELESGA